MPSDLTTFHVRQAIDGSAASVEWIVERFTPALLVTAHHRLGEVLRRYYDPEDVVNEVWMTTIPKLGALERRDDRFTPVLMRYLSTSLVSRINNLARRFMRRSAASIDGDESSGAEPIEVPSSLTGVITKVSSTESYRLLDEALDELSDDDREIVILRGFEQISNADVARRLGIKPNTAAVRYARALTRLREKLTGTVLDDLDAA